MDIEIGGGDGSSPSCSSNWLIVDISSSCTIIFLNNNHYNNYAL